MFRYYIGFPLAKLARRQWPHPGFNTKYNALQRAEYFSIPLAVCLSVATGWAIHKPMQFHSLAAIFGGFDAARVWHFWLMWVFILFVVPPCDPGFGRRVGYVPRNDRRLVGESKAVGGHG